MTDSDVTDAGPTGLPEEPPNDAFDWTAEAGEPDVAGMPAEFANEPADGVPGVRSSKQDFDQKSNN